MPQLDICNITHFYKKKRALVNVSASLTNGVVALVGPNGAGKSTLISIIVGLLNPTRGDVLFDGKSIISLGKQYYHYVGYCPQVTRFYPNFTAYEFLMYMGTMKQIPHNELKGIANNLLSLVNLEQQRDVKIGTFSGGMKQRLGIAQALLNDPKLLILDEPTAGLDPNERIRFRNLISKISKNRIVILATHIISDVENIANQVLILRRGELIINDSPASVLAGVSKFVWEIPEVENEQIDAYSQRFLVSNIRHAEGKYEVKVISNVKPTDSAHLSIPTMEDAFLYYFGRGDE